MDFASSGGGGNAFDFSKHDLYAISTMVDADHAKLGTLRSQAKGWRQAAALADAQRGRLDEGLQSARTDWSGAGATTFTEESGRVTKSMSDSYYTFDGNATAIDRMADETTAVKGDVDEIKADWEHVKAMYAANHHIFDGASESYPDGYQYMTNVLYPKYVQEARERMNLAANEYQTAWYTSLHEPKPYDGPTIAPEPKHSLDNPTQWMGSGNGGVPTHTDTGYGNTPTNTGTSSSPSTSAPTPTPTPIQPQPDGPRTEFPTPTPTPTLPTPSPVVPGPPVVPTAPPGSGLTPPPFTPGGFPPGTPLPGTRPPVGGRPGLFPNQATSANAARATRGVIGARPGTAAARPGVRTPRAATPERGVIRNPNRAQAETPARANPRETLSRLKSERQKRREDLEARVDQQGGQEDLFAVTGLAVDAVLRPDAPVTIRRGEAGPVIGRAWPREK